jgi:hypothetical protein
VFGLFGGNGWGIGFVRLGWWNLDLLQVDVFWFFDSLGQINLSKKGCVS